MTGKCALYTASDDDSIRTEDNAVPVTFAAPSSSSSPPPNGARHRHPAEHRLADDRRRAAPRACIFSGFKPGEQVNLTLFSDPITLSPVTADATGVARVEFIVPADFAAGTHRLEADRPGVPHGRGGELRGDGAAAAFADAVPFAHPDAVPRAPPVRPPAAASASSPRPASSA